MIYPLHHSPMFNETLTENFTNFVEENASNSISHGI